MTRETSSFENTVSVPLLDIDLQNRPLRDELLTAVTEVIDSGAFIFGPDCEALENEIAEYCETEYGIGCASGSDALLLALMAMEVGHGDEVILPAFTFFATAGAVWRLGAKPVFVDIEPGSFNIDPELIEQHLTPQTKAIIPVHLFGQCANMTAINEIAERNGVFVIEDAAQAIGARHRGKAAGSLGSVGCFSFYPTKNLGGIGDGGMITTHDAALDKQLRSLRNHGAQNRYFHDHVGVNSRLDSLQAAALRIKLRHLDSWSDARARNATAYAQQFAAVGLSEILGIPSSDQRDRHVWNQYTVRIATEHRDQVREFLGTNNIGSGVYYPLGLHLQPCFASLGYKPGSLPNTERATQEVLSLPVFAEMNTQQQQAVVTALSRYFAIDAQTTRTSAA